MYIFQKWFLKHRSLNLVTSYEWVQALVDIYYI